MEKAGSPRVISAERNAGSVIIAFDDGKCAVYSADLLLSIFNHAEAVLERNDDSPLDDSSPVRT